jgi:hypothetical protein
MIKVCKAEIKFTNQTVGELAQALTSLPEHARVSIRTEKHYDQRDPGGTWLVFNWTEEIK